MSQFTLLADVRRGNRPCVVGRRGPPRRPRPWSRPTRPRVAAEGVPVERGPLSAPPWPSRLENDGPVTIVLDSADLRAPRSSAG